MRKFLCLLPLILAFSTAAAQRTTLKTNALYWAAAVPNLSAETRLSPHWTLNGDVVVSLWESIRGRPYKGLQAIVEARYYVCQAFCGFYAGLYGAYDRYTTSKWDHPAHDVQHGNGWNLGLTLGYQLPIGRRWNMDFYVGGGWHHGQYYGVDTRTGTRYAPWNASGEWIPYKVGVAFALKL